MANAKAGVHVLGLRPIDVPSQFREGHKFIKWDEDSGNGTLVTLRIDDNGFFLYWTDQNNECEFLDIASIRDTRSSRGARTPRDPRLRELVNMGGSDQALEDKTLTVVYGPDLVNVSYINFCCNEKTVAQEWSRQILRMSYNLLALNGSAYMFMIKTHTKILLMKDRDGKIPVKNIVRMFATHKDDRKRVEKALEQTGLPHGKNENISPDQLTLDKFLRFAKHLVARTEVDAIFERFCSSAKGSKNKLMTVDELVKFLNQEQRDPRLNEILHPYADTQRGQEIIAAYEPSKENVAKALMSVEGFLRYLMSDENTPVAPEKYDLNADMDQPLNHYFINSSHNTYLTGHQLTGKASVEIYRQCLLAGCRCIELDCWNGRGSDDEPIITHGYTVVSDIVLKDVLEAIAETAFKTSDYPVVLSFENHCSAKQQAKIAQYCRKIFGDMLLTEPLPSYPLKPDVPLPSPRQLMRKIIIKNKKKHHHVRRERKARSPGTATAQTATGLGPQQGSGDPQSGSGEVVGSPASGSGMSMLSSTPERRATLTTKNSDESNAGGDNSTRTSTIIEREDSSQLNDSDEGGSAHDPHPVTKSSTALATSSCDVDDVDSDSSEDDETMAAGDLSITTDEIAIGEPGDVNQQASAHIKEPEAGAEMSALVLYMQPVRFHSFEHAEKRKRSYEISSFVETQATSLLKERPVDFVNFNKRQMSRIYPKGTRVDSSNYMPQVFWNAGCQMVALNYQTLDLGMQLNLGIFEYNGRSGYLLKPDFMRRNDRRFDPFTESTVDGIIAGTVSVKIISGQFLSDKRTGTFVEVDMFGLPADTVRRKRTRIVPNNGLNPVYGDETFTFKKVVLPELACIRIAAYEESGKLIGQRILSVVGLRPGYRHVSLRNESSQPLLLPSLFVHITVKDYVPEGFADLADALANPIAFQSESEKRAKQLHALTEDSEVSVKNDAHHCETSSTKVVVTAEPSERKPLASQSDTKRDQQHSTSSTAFHHHHQPQAGPSSANNGSAHVRPVGHQLSRHDHDSMNGALSGQRSSISTSPSPVHPHPQVASSSSAAGSAGVPPLLRQDTFATQRGNQSIRSLSDENPAGADDKQRSLLESDDARIVAESLDQLREHKSVQKVMTKMEKELAALKKKYEKLKEKEISLIQQKEDKIIHAQEKQKVALQKTHSRTGFMLGRKSSSVEASNISVAIESSSQTREAKLEELHKAAAQDLYGIIVEHQKKELELYEKHTEQVYTTLEKQMQLSQSSQNSALQDLHDQEVATLMKRLEAQHKEDMTNVGKKHKDKNELARIKRELQQRLIDQAVNERSRLKGQLEKRKLELEAQHETVRLEWAKEKENEMKQYRKRHVDRMSILQEEFEINPIAFYMNLLHPTE